jgi:hypothetical protein
MSSFDSWQAAGLAIAFLFVAWFWLRHWHVGFGTVLRWRERDGTIWICSRLLEHPAHLQGIEGRSQLVSVNGHAMKFSSVKEFEAWMKSHCPKLNQEDIWVVQQGMSQKTVVMKPVFITTSIPVYWSPNTPIRAEEFFQPRIRWLNAVCDAARKPERHYGVTA